MSTTTPTQVLAPLRELLPAQVEESGVLSTISGLQGLLDGLFYSDVWSEWQANELQLFLALHLFDEVAIGIPLLPGLELVVGASDEDPQDISVVGRVGQHWSLLVEGIPLRLRFPPEILRPVNPELTATEVTLTADISCDDDLNFSLDLADEINVPLSYIAGTSVAIGLTDISVNFVATNGSRGIFAREAVLRLPPEVFGECLDLNVEDFQITAAGVSGKADWSAPGSGEDAPAWNEAEKKFTGIGCGRLSGALPFSVRSVSIELIENVPQRADVVLHAFLPFFEQVVAIEASLGCGGDFLFSLAAARDLQPDSVQVSPSGLVSLRKEGLFDLEVTGLMISCEGGDAAIELSGSIRPLFVGLDWPSFEVRSLMIDTSGRIRIDGGWLSLPSTKSFEFYGFQMELSKIGFGTDDDGTRWIGLSGGIQLVEGLPMGGSVEGLKIKWKGDNVSLEMRGIAVQMVVPGALEIAGRVEFINEDSKKGFKGGVKLRIIPTNVLVDAQLMIGKNSQAPAYTFAYVYVAGELPAGIPLGNTGVALYGLAGLVGYNVTPAKDVSELWFGGWYLRPPVGVSDVTKWRDERGSFALGLGATLGTAVDNGYAFSGRFLLVLILPGPVLLLDGKCNVLNKRGSDPQMVSLAVFDGRAGTLLFNIQASFCYPEGGKLLNVTAASEAYFDFGNPRNWHLYIGMDTPEEKRVRASILSLWEVNAYLMLDYSGVRFGARYGYNAHWTFGPLKAVLEAWLEGGAAIGWSPLQMEGQLRLHGDVSLTAFGFGAGVGLDALMLARAPHPYYVHGELSFKLKTPWPLPDAKGSIELTWEEEVPPPTPRPLETIGLEHLKVTEKWMMGSDSSNAPIVPLDARPVLSFQRSVFDHTGLSPNAYPPAPEQCGSFLFRYHLDEIRIEKRDSASGGWTDVTTPPAPSLPAGKIWGMWQAVPSSIGESGGLQGEASTTKLMLWSKTPFDYGRETGGSANTDGFLDGNPDWPCGYDWTPIWQWTDFMELSLDTKMPVVSSLGELTIFALGASVTRYRPIKTDVTQAVTIWQKANVKTAKSVPLNKGGLVQIQDIQLRKGATNIIRVFFPASAARACLLFGKGTNGRCGSPGEMNHTVDCEVEEREIHIQPESGNVTCIELTGDIVLLKIGWADAVENERCIAGDGLTKDLCNVAADLLDTDPEILEPHREYRLTAKTRVERSANDGESWDEVGTFTDQGYFRTVSAPGLASATSTAGFEPTDSSEHYPERGPLRDLRPYVLNTVPKDGALSVYRSYDIGVEFNESYTEKMYLMEGKPLILKVKDVNGQPVNDSTGKPTAVINQWSPLAPSVLSRVLHLPEKVWSDVINSVRGFSTSISEPKGMWVCDTELLLAPLTIYKVMLGPVQPSAIIPLDVDGRILMSDDNKPVCRTLGGSFPNRLEMITTASAGRKLLISNDAAAETDLGSEEAARPLEVSDSEQISLLNSVIKDLNLPTGETRPVFDWSFTTSKFVNFVHHLHSWPDIVHDLYADCGSPPDDLLDNNELSWLEDVAKELPTGVPARSKEDDKNANTRRESEAQNADKALEMFGLNGRQIPEVVSVTLINDFKRSYGILIESPEPLPANRVTFSISRHKTPIKSAPLDDSPAKIVALGFADSDSAADLVSEYVDIIALKTFLLAGARILLKDNGNDWQEYYTFTETGTILEGTLIRVHTGSADADTNPLQEVRHFYMQDNGGQATRRFTKTRPVCRIVDAKGIILHERFFLKGGFDAISEFRILRSRDDTRMLIFFGDKRKAVGSVKSGTLRTTWRFERNISDTHPNDPILRRLGSDRTENTILDLPIF